MLLYCRYPNQTTRDLVIYVWFIDENLWCLNANLHSCLLYKNIYILHKYEFMQNLECFKLDWAANCNPYSCK